VTLVIPPGQAYRSGASTVVQHNLEPTMKIVHAAAALLLVLATAGCASTGSSGTPWMTAYGCDPLIAVRYGKSC